MEAADRAADPAEVPPAEAPLAEPPVHKVADRAVVQVDKVAEAAADASR